MSLLTMRPLELGIHLLEIARNPSLLKDYGDYEDSFSSMRKVLLLSAKSSLLHSKDPLIRKSGNAMMDLALNAHLLDMHCRNLNRRMIRSTTNDEHILSRILMALKRFENLTCLKLIIYCIDCDVLNILSEYCKNLISLTLNFLAINDPNALISITNLKQLRDLRIRFGEITDIFCEKLRRNCQDLRRLELIDCRGIEAMGMNAIAALPKLQIFGLRPSFAYDYDYISQHERERKDISFRNEFTNLRGLHELDYEDWSDIQDKQIVTVIRNSPELRYLNINQGRYITANIVFEAKKISASRHNNVPLELRINSSTIQLKCVICNGKIY